MSRRAVTVQRLIHEVPHGRMDAANDLMALFLPELRAWVAPTNPYREEIIQEALIMAIIGRK